MEEMVREEALKLFSEMLGLDPENHPNSFEQFLATFRLGATWMTTQGCSSKECIDIYKENRRLFKRLKDAEEVIAFYADAENWSQGETTYYDTLTIDDCADYPHITRDVKWTGGKRARVYFAANKEGVE